MTKNATLEKPLTIHDPDGQLPQLDVPLVKRSPRKDGTVSLLGKGEETDAATAPATPAKDDKPRHTFTKDPVTGELVFDNGTRVKPALSAEAQKAADAQAANETARASLSFARQRMEARRKAKEAAGLKQIVPVTIEGEEWFIKRLSAAESLALPYFIAGRDGNTLDLAGLDPKANDDDRHALFIAIIYACTVAGVDDYTPAFASVNEVWEQFDESGDDEFVLQLIGEILKHSPHLLKNLTGG